MNGNSKREKVESFVRRAVMESLQSVAWDYPSIAVALKERGESIAMRAGHNAVDIYRMKELSDIMNWKKPPQGD